jgi:surface antigen
MKKMLFAATALAIFGFVPALAQSQGVPPPRDPNGYYSQHDQEGYYDRNGNYIRYKDQQPDDNGYTQYNAPPRPYRNGDYEDQCRRGNSAAGTLFGALAGGLIGGAASSGHHHGADAGAVVGGVILGGMLGNAMTRDIPCEDHDRAFNAYAESLNGPLGQRTDWNNDANGDYGYIVPVSEFPRNGATCRIFDVTTFRRGEKHTRRGTACRQPDGNWRFD